LGICGIGNKLILDKQSVTNATLWMFKQ